MIVLLADFLPVFGVTFVSAMTNSSWLMSMSSSSPAIISRPVSDPVPWRMPPVLIDAVLSALIVIHESIWYWSNGPLLANGLSAACALPARPAPSDAEADDQRAAALDERLARELLVEHLGHGYFPPFAITAAAFWIAVRIRGYVPQRHRWPFIAVRICASVGRFVVASRSAAWIIIPFWQ